MFALLSLMAVVVLGTGIAATIDGAVIAADGSVIQGEIVAARHGSKGTSSRCAWTHHREVDLRAWRGGWHRRSGSTTAEPEPEFAGGPAATPVTDREVRR
jgi:hypothetical protein